MPSISTPRWRNEAHTMPAPGARSASRSPARSVMTSGVGAYFLLQLDGAAGLLELGLELVGLLALDALLDGLGGLVDERLGLLEAEAGGRAHDLDDLDLLVARRGEDDVDRRGLLLLGGAVAAAATAGRGRRRDRLGRDAELLFKGLDALGQLEHGDALELVDPFLGAGRHVCSYSSSVEVWDSVSAGVSSPSAWLGGSSSGVEAGSAS